MGKATTIDFSVESVDRTCAEMGKYADVQALCVQARIKVVEIDKDVKLTRGA